MTYTIANFIFWACFVSVAIFIYQGIILPGMRVSLRYRVFELRDKLRRAVIEGKLEEHDKAFQLLHDRLNFMCVSLARFDLARVIQAANRIDDETRERSAAYVQIMKSAPDEVNKIFNESLHVFTLALTYNSLFTFVVSAVCLLVIVAVKSSFRQVKELFLKKVNEDTTLAFFSLELATV